jgi:hypothetical protein
LTSTTTRRPKPAETPLDDDLTERRPRYLTGYESDGTGGRRRRSTSAEIWSAQSTDQRWVYERTDTPGTPWMVRYQPTGQEVPFTTLADGRRWTARDEYALAFLRAEALQVIARLGEASGVLAFNPGTPESTRAAVRARAAVVAAERLGRARRCVAVLDGLVLADDPDTRCTGGGECGGYLTVAIAGDRAAWVHADTCRECINVDPAKRRECHDLHRHVPCGDPDPVLCEHLWCTTPTVLLAGQQCPAGRDDCCGCCDADTE